ncbi:hypoxanthine-guanine phosphoribosyltransferase [Luteibacter pinisoli]|uniref:Hypoxanthine-guanine phosphoribosyltransferase n=1 Tax=Luteibacter pinisoli TaxID=2589080 RepID=A0A4Y5Z1T4_9GAMM|nr:hypoxanthine-guanine phosphoribosyltransferase [Luteibacter pinisoli]QDE39242.1 hypoxanthine-guanine phosphoribosyltransferase [Luteibacter pinisoli]
MTATASLEHALANADVLFTREHLDTEIARMGRELDAALAGERPVFLTVMHGALIFAGQLALAMKTDLEFDYVHATRYRGATTGAELHWLRRPEVPLQDRTVVLVDDILDEGHTLKAVRDACTAMGAKRVLLAVLCTKLHDRRAEGIDADFNGVDLPDRYVFGYGMDYHEQARNLPAIYALKD